MPPCIFGISVDRHHCSSAIYNCWLVLSEISARSRHTRRLSVSGITPVSYRYTLVSIDDKQELVPLTGRDGRVEDIATSDKFQNTIRYVRSVKAKRR